MLEIATIWDSFFLRHSKSDRLDKEPFAKRNVKGLQQGVESNGMSMGQMRAGAERGSVALACGPCVPRQRPIKAGRGGGLGQWANSWPRSYECRMSSARNTSPPACSQRNLLFPGTSSPRTARSWAGPQGNHGQGSCSILALHRAMPASCACSHPVAQDVPARTRTARARDIHAHTHDAHVDESDRDHHALMMWLPSER